MTHRIPGRTLTRGSPEVLKSKKLRLARKEETLRRAWTDLSPWVFCTEAGTFLYESKVRRIFAAMLAKAELSSFRVHDLRDTFASLLLAQGALITYVSAQLGHSRSTATLQWYAHWLPAGGSASWTTSPGRPSRGVGNNLAPKANRALPLLWKSPIRLVGRGGLEPPTR